MVVIPPFHNALSGTAVRLSGRSWGSAGSFCAVTVTVGIVTCCGGGAGCAPAIRGVTTPAHMAE